MIGRLVNRDTGHAQADRQVAVVRLIALPVIVAGELLVSHPEQHTALYLPFVGLAAVYSAATLVCAVRGRPLPASLTGALDVLLLSALVYTSGGPFSQARFAFFLVPVAAALVVGPRQTAVASLAVIVAYIAISLVHPATDERSNAVEFELAQGFYLALVGAAATLLSYTLRERTRRIDALAASRNRLVAQALEAEDRERRRLAEALHDESIQNLLAARQELGGGAESKPDLDFVRAGLDRTVKQLRDAVFELHPYVLEHGGLGPALRAVAEQHGRRHGFEHHVEVDSAAAGLEDQLLFSVGRELITNAAKHADAGRVTVHVRRHPEEIELEVSDDGRGIDQTALRLTPLAGHLGLASCAERIEAVGGRFEIVGRSGQGATARALVPTGNHRAPAAQPAVRAT
ncbi:MAG TPA: ATP-binding protein [Thermoleophilaceae bacterium]|nr:ATP-binding protein [Thermoleophilaceae bacterium]